MGNSFPRFICKNNINSIIFYIVFKSINLSGLRCYGKKVDKSKPDWCLFKSIHHNVTLIIQIINHHAGYRV